MSMYFSPTVNAADNKQRDKAMNCIKVNIDVWVTLYFCSTKKDLKAATILQQSHFLETACKTPFILTFI